MTALLVAGLACVAVGLLWGAWEWAVRHAPVDPDESSDVLDALTREAQARGAYDGDGRAA